ncbi:hypothetical protein ACH5RR_031717 [Cinchona calisaya]|uniref:Protein kinase domain-containing protein n=1 Tax=Cinchona calisaya TaxID=153742 RepID=A0ABD2YKA4_9GENT
MRGETTGTSGQQLNLHPVNTVPSDDTNGHKSGLNVSLQTGEEFAEEFLRERLTPRKPPVTNDTFQRQQNGMGINVVQNHPLVYEDLTGLLGIKRRDSESSDFCPQGGYTLEVENQEQFDGSNRYRREHIASGQQQARYSDGSNSDRAPPGTNGPSVYASGSPNSYQPYNSGLGYTDASFAGKVKFLCSFGGRILPRPNDGKLRYVGGETRIMSIRKNLTYGELVRKTTAICNQPHTIKYQLPGEDLDALISVSSDEDLHHMIEEYHDLERSSQRLRIFLVSLNDPDSPCSLEARTGPQVDADYQYVVAVNGMLDPSPRRSSSRESLGSQKGTAFDNSPIQRESPTSFHPLEVRDGGSSLNKMSHPSSTAQVVNTPKSVFASPMSPVPVQINDPRSSHTKLYKDIARFDGHEFNSPYAMEQPAYDNSYNLNATSYNYNQQPDTVATKNYCYPISRYIESNQAADLHSRVLSPGRSFMGSPSCAQVEMDTKRHMVNDMAMQSENLKFPQDISGLFPGSGNSFKSHNRMVHAVSQPQLLREVEPSATLEERNTFPSNFVIEKSPSFGGSSQEWQFQHVENSEEKYRGTRNDTPPTQDWNKEFIEWREDTSRLTENEGTSLDRGRTDYRFSDRNTSNATPREDKINLPEIVSRANEMLIECCLLAEPEVCRNRNSASTSSSVGNSRDTRGGQEENYQSRPYESKFIVKSWKDTEEHELTLAKDCSSNAINCSFGAHTDTCQGMDRPLEESFLSFNLNYPLNTDLSFTNPSNSTKPVIVDPVHQEARHDPPGEMVKGPNRSVKKEILKKDSSEISYFRDQMFVTHPSTQQHDNNILESTFIVEDVTDSIPPDVPSSPAIIPLVQDEPSDGSSSAGEETATESVVLESDHEEDNVDHGSKNDSIGEAALMEMEAGIYGLQIINYADVEELQELGSGTFGTVYHGKWRGTDVAIKRIKKSCFAGRLSEQDRLTKDFWREAQILSKLHHPNVVAFYGVVPDGPGGTLATVTEFMVDGSLRHVLLRKGALDRRKKLMIALDAAFGMEYLHLKNIVHFDLKCDNLLVNLGDPQRPVCKVGDFGLSRIKRNTLVSGGVRGTLPWMAPELLHGISNRVSEKVDVFSFGITMWEILTGEEPYANLHCGAIIGGIVNNTLRPRIPERCDPEWKHLMEECWSPDPAARPSFTQITNRLRVMSAALQPKRQNRLRR